MYGSYFEGQMCADGCVKFKGKVIPGMRQRYIIRTFWYFLRHLNESKQLLRKIFISFFRRLWRHRFDCSIPQQILSIELIRTFDQFQQRDIVDVWFLVSI